jgi:hypothetical protein
VLFVSYEKRGCGSVFKEDETGRACSTNGEKRNAYRILVGKPKEKKLLGRPRRTWVYNTKIRLKEIV